MGELKRLRVALAWKGQTQKWLSEETGIHYVTLSEIIRGRTNPTDEEKRRIAHALRLPVDRLFSKLSEDEMAFLYGPQRAKQLKENL